MRRATRFRASMFVSQAYSDDDPGGLEPEQNPVIMPLRKYLTLISIHYAIGCSWRQILAEIRTAYAVLRSQECLNPADSLALRHFLARFPGGFLYINRRRNQ